MRKALDLLVAVLFAAFVVMAFPAILFFFGD